MKGAGKETKAIQDKDRRKGEKSNSDQRQMERGERQFRPKTDGEGRKAIQTKGRWRGEKGNSE